MVGVLVVGVGYAGDFYFRVYCHAGSHSHSHSDCAGCQVVTWLQFCVCEKVVKSTVHRVTIPDQSNISNIIIALDRA